MSIKEIYSIEQISKQYETGEMPVLVRCSDRNDYICKYMRTPSSAYKLVCELIGAYMIKNWSISSPQMNLVRIKREHWNSLQGSKYISQSPAVGYMKLSSVFDITHTTYAFVKKSKETLVQLLKIALFDFWMSNEDRTYSNANLLYDLKTDEFVSIDYGGIFNTSCFNYPMSLLTQTDSILYSEVFKQYKEVYEDEVIMRCALGLKEYYIDALDGCKGVVKLILKTIPIEWCIDDKIVSNKISQILDSEWVEKVWDNYIQCLKDNLYE